MREESSLAALRALTLLPPVSAHAHRRIGLLHVRAGRIAEAVASFNAALARGLPAGVDVRHPLGQALLAAGQPEAAAEHFGRSVTLDPKACCSHQGLGQALVLLGRLSEAKTAFRRGLDACPGHGWLSYHLAQLLIAEGQHAEALDLLIETGLNEAADPPPVLPSAPVPARGPQATQARIAALRKVVERFPEHADYTFVLTRLLSALGDYAQARAALDALRLRQWQHAKPGLAPDPAGPTPAFLIIGQGKAGTTSLAAYLCQHPLVLPALIKEVRYWSDSPAASMPWYRTHFPPIPAGSGLITGDASPQYLVDTRIPAQVARDCPDVKLIVLLRDPIARAYSAYRMHQRIGRETRRWEDVVDTELAAVPLCPLQREDIRLQDDGSAPEGYLVRSAVLPFLRCWLAHFPPERFLILQHDDLCRNAATTVRRVYRFLDLPDFVPDCAERHNVGQYQPMSPETRRRLEDWFAPHQQALAAFLTERFA
jgi:tetratricopeptide (TPR) repeat protein